MANSQKFKGLILALLAAVISGFSVFINKVACSFWHNSDIYTTEKNIVSAVIISAIILSYGYWSKLTKLDRSQWVKIIIIGLVGGSIPFILFFRGLAGASAPVANFINKTLFVWVALLAWPMLKERLSKIQLAAFAVLIFGNLILFLPSKFHFSYAEFLILAATIIWAVEYSLAKKFMANIAPEILAWGRMLFGGIALVGYLIAIGQIGQIGQIRAEQIVWVLIVGITLSFYLLALYGAIKRIPVTLVASILVIASPITTLLDRIINQKTLPTNFWLMVALSIAAIAVLAVGSINQKRLVNERDF